MATVVDNLIAYRVLSMLVKPFPETDAYKLGIIDETGKNLIKPGKFTKPEQRTAYTYLHRLVFNLKKLINKLPGGESYLKNIVAAFFLIKEAYEAKQTTISEERLHNIVRLLEDGVVFCEEQLLVEDFFICEDAPVNATGPAVATNEPVIRKKKRRFAKFVVNNEVFAKFAGGKAKFRKWSEYLNLEDDGQRLIYQFAKSNPDGVIVLQNGQEVKAIRFNRRGGGSWSKLKRPSRQINNEVV